MDEFWKGKLCDFGLSRIKASETMSRLGTIQYSAPEVLRGERYTEMADIFRYSIGRIRLMIVLAFWSGKHSLNAFLMMDGRR